MDGTFYRMKQDMILRIAATLSSPNGIGCIAEVNLFRFNGAFNRLLFEFSRYVLVRTLFHYVPHNRFNHNGINMYKL